MFNPFPRLREQHSLFGEILDWLLAPLLLLWPLSIASIWLVAQGIANGPFDSELGYKVRVLAKQVTLTQAERGRPTAQFVLPPSASELLRTDEADDIYYQVLGLRGEFLSGERSIAVPMRPQRRPVGEVLYRDDVIDNRDVRVAYVWVDLPTGAGTGASLVQVAETLGRRARLASDIFRGVILPQFLILPLAVLLAWLALSRGMAPLNELQQRIRRRKSNDLSAIDERDVPEEVSPLVRAINDLLARLEQSLRAQNHFLADAAHQLKTPLAGLRMQAELAQRDIDAGERDPLALKKSLRQIARSSQSAAHMVNQLLAMARADDREHAAPMQAVNLADLAVETVRDFVPRALERRIDLGYEAPVVAARHPRGPVVSGEPVLLRELMRNLIDNALLYTPAGGTVTVRVLDDPFGQVVVLQVEDSGPGIPPTEREQVFQPFYRALGTNVDGSGLGLAIVHEIASRHGAELTLTEANLRHRGGLADPAAAAFGPGARFTLRFAAAAEVAGAAPAVNSA
ncbi:MAG: histidine kinase [Methylibium sp. NZG]|nr:MAG: histidine kinase [Methylibium sp. NZG]